MTKVNKWTLGLAALGLVSLPAMVQAEEKPNQLLTALSTTTISGYVDTSAQWTLGSGNANPPGYSFNGPNKQDGFNLNAVNVVLEKPLDEGTWSAGYKVDLIYGANAIAFNNTVGSDTSDFSIKQAYVALRAPLGNGIDIKIGTFDTIIGYEVFNSGSNPNYTRSYGYTMEPTQHTGVLASYQVNKVFGFSAGIANTWAAGINQRSERGETDKSYMGAFTLTAPESFGSLAGSALYVGIVDGYSSSVGNDVTSYYVGATVATPIKALKVGAAFDYQTSHDNNLNHPGYSESLALYASIQSTEKLSFHLRGEFAEYTQSLTGSGYGNEVLAFTGTIQYDLWANVLSRLELRWDHVSDGHNSYGGETAGSPNDRDEYMVAANIIYKF